jgi:hypothetical protein
MSRFMSDTLAKSRQLTGDTRYDSLLGADATGYVRYLLTGKLDAVIADFENDAKAFGMNRPGYTSEMRYTDRVLTFNDRWFNYWAAEPVPAPQLLSVYSALTGDPGNPLIFPLNAVRWHTPPRQFAALVSASGTDKLIASLFHFGDQPRSFSAELFLLKPGRYAWTLQMDSAADRGTEQELIVTAPRSRIQLTLPPRQLCQLIITPAR